MQVEHVSNFRVRWSECDAYGHLYNSNYLRLIEQTSRDAWEQTGPFESLADRWNLKSAYIEFLRPIRYGEEFQIRTSVADIGTQAAKRDFEFRLSESNDIAATARTESSFVEPFTGQPTEVLEELANAFLSGRKRTDNMRVPETPQAPRPPGAFVSQRKVEWRDVGPDKKMQKASYLDYLLDFVLQAAASCGWSLTRSEEQGFAVVVRRQWVEYIEPAMYGDQLQMTTWLSDLKRSTVTRHYTIHRALDKSLIMRAQTLWVCIDIHSERPVRIPVSWKEDFAPQIST